MEIKELFGNKLGSCESTEVVRMNRGGAGFVRMNCSGENNSRGLD